MQTGGGVYKNSIWQTLCKYFFQKFVKETDTVCDIAAGYCEFINAIKCDKKIAVDLNPDVKKMAADDVLVVCASVFSLQEHISTNTVDCFFVSNFLEHLDSKADVIRLMKLLTSLLKKGGRILVLQPNIRLVGGAYWDFIDHKTELTEKSLVELAELCNLKVEKCVTRFLPYTTKSALPKGNFIIRLYLLLMPISSFFFGKQSFLVLKKT